MIYQVTHPTIIASVLLHPAIKAAVDDVSPVESTEDMVRALGMLQSAKVFGYGPPAAPHGLFVCIQHTNVTWDFHGNVLPEHRDKDSVTPAKMVIDWMFTHEPCEKITTTIAAHLKGVIRHCFAVGFKVEGTCRDSVRHNGSLEDRLYFGIRKGEWPCHG